MSVRAGTSCPYDRSLFVLIGLIVVITLIALPMITYPLGRDQGEFATIGRGILDGRIPYVDLWNPKPPAVFYVYALAMTLFGRTTEALRVIDLLLFPPIAAALYWIGRRHRQRARRLVGGAAVRRVLLHRDLLDADAERRHRAAADGAGGRLRDQGGGRRRSDPRCGRSRAGALSAYAIWFKYPFAIFVGVVVFAYVWVRALTPRLSPTLAAGCSLGLPSAGGLLIGAGRDRLHDGDRRVGCAGRKRAR